MWNPFRTNKQLRQEVAILQWKVSEVEDDLENVQRLVGRL